MDLERRALEERVSVSEPLSLRGLSSRVELDEGGESRRVERGVGSHLDQVERTEEREQPHQPVLERTQVQVQVQV